ncbi:type VII secretion target [Streptomyces chattanoogensis]|uniref:type VII secretion target n=1 Tax=Streptomyces chattanoogensis TaxID=66876 RepID=UPI0036CF0CE6
MAEQFTAAQEALRAFAKTADQRADKVRAIRSSLASHSVHREAFGKLPESEEISTDYEERQEDTLETLEDIATLQEKISEGVTATAQSYQDTDDEQIRTLNSVQHGGGSI